MICKLLVLFHNYVRSLPPRMSPVFSPCKIFIYNKIHNRKNQSQTTPFWDILSYSSSSECSAQGQVFHCKLGDQGCRAAQRQVFHCKFRNQGWGMTRCDSFPLLSTPTLYLAFEQTLKVPGAPTWRWGEWIWDFSGKSR